MRRSFSALSKREGRVTISCLHTLFTYASSSLSGIAFSPFSPSKTSPLSSKLANAPSMPMLLAHCTRSPRTRGIWPTALRNSSLEICFSSQASCIKPCSNCTMDSFPSNVISAMLSSFNEIEPFPSMSIESNNAAITSSSSLSSV